MDKIKGQKYHTFIHPVQGFLRKNFTVDPGIEYTYFVTALSGMVTNSDRSVHEQITITTELNIDNGLVEYLEVDKCIKKL